MTLIITAILAGTWGLTAALLVVSLLRLELRIKPAIINAMGLLLLFASSLYLLETVVAISNAFKAGERSYFGSVEFFTIFFAWPFAFGILPQLLWLKIFRQQLVSLVALAFVWTMTLFFVPWGLPQLRVMPFSYLGYIGIVTIYAAAFFVIYRLTAKKEIIASIQNAKAKKYVSSY